MVGASHEEGVQVVKRLIDVIREDHRGRFASVVYRNKAGELSRQTLIASPRWYGKGGMLDRSLQRVESMTPEEFGIVVSAVAVIVDRDVPAGLCKAVPDGSTVATECETARTEMAISLAASLKRGKPPESHPYETVPGVHGLRRHSETGGLSVVGVSVSREVIEAGEYKHTVSAVKTIAKRVIGSTLGLPKYKTLRLPDVSVYAANGRRFEAVTEIDATD